MVLTGPIELGSVLSDDQTDSDPISGRISGYSYTDHDIGYLMPISGFQVGKNRAESMDASQCGNDRDRPSAIWHALNLPEIEWI